MKAFIIFLELFSPLHIILLLSCLLSITCLCLHAGLFDVDKEIARLQKQRDKLEKDLAAVAGRMANKAFMDKAPPKVVAETLQQKEEAEQKVAAIAEKINQMSVLAR